MKGTVYFKDGHTEAITWYQVLDKYHVRFTTETGIYYFSHPYFYIEKCAVFEISITGGMVTKIDHFAAPDIIKIEIPN